MEIENITTKGFGDKEKINGMIDVRACNKPAGKVSLHLLLELYILESPQFTLYPNQILFDVVRSFRSIEAGFQSRTSVYFTEIKLAASYLEFLPKIYQVSDPSFHFLSRKSNSEIIASTL